MMIDNWYDAIEMSKMRDESIRNDIYKIRNRRRDHELNDGYGTFSDVVLGNLGKAFSFIGDTIQLHTHSDFENNKKHMKKVS